MTRIEFDIRRAVGTLKLKGGVYVYVEGKGAQLFYCPMIHISRGSKPGIFRPSH